MQHRIVSQGEWLQERAAFLAKEKELTRLRDRLAEERRALPWVQVEKTYVFDTPAGKKTLAELFEGRSQLIVKFFMLAPGQKEGCVGCSFEADHVEGTLVHLEHHDVSYVAVARAPLDEIEAFKKRMGWSFRWVSSSGNDFSYDFHASFKPAQLENGTAFYNYRTGPVPLEDLSGFAVFHKDEQGRIFHTYSTFGRGLEEVLGTYMFLDITPNGRNENGPNHSLADWVRHHDRYGADGHVSAVGRWVPEEQGASCCHGTAA
jgi:predicted dithiol-disulfide oxidoreductase (DUF899 family)